ncbi:hypothetical protein [Romboutsia sp.]|uniref:hypothetical protein n=1 Tax=Romboutsia sp. TaxID=1965302 RepID=UPI003F2E099E
MYLRQVVKEKIEYSGISSYIPDNIKAFTQVNINEIIYIDKSTPDLSDLVKVELKSNISNSRIVKTPRGKSLDGQYLTGWKLLSNGFLDVRLDYCSNTTNTALCTTKIKIPFNCGVTLSEKSTYKSKIINTVFIEDIHADILDKKSALINVNLIFISENCE